MLKEINPEKQKAALLTQMEILHLRQEALSKQIEATQQEINEAEIKYVQLDPPPTDPEA